MAPPIRRLAGFAVVPGISALMPLISITVIQRALGADLWAEAAIGMAVGMFGSGFIDFGYGVLGPSRVARSSDQRERARVYAASMRVRLWVSGVTLPILYLAAEALGPMPGIGGAGAVAVATAVVGLAPNWFYIGVGRPMALVAADTLPRLAATAVSAGLLLVWPSLNLYGFVLCTGVLSAYAISTRRIMQAQPSIGFRLQRSDVHEMRTHLALVGSGMLSSAYSTLTSPIVGAVAPYALASYAAADRLRGMVRQLATAGGNGLQGWTSERLGERQVTRARMRFSLLVMTGLGVVAAGGTALLMAPLQELISGGAVLVGQETALFAGISLFFITVGISLNYHVLAPLQRASVMAVGGAVGAAVGIPAVTLLGRAHGAPGAMAGVAIAEAMSVVCLLLAARSALRRWVSETDV